MVDEVSARSDNMLLDEVNTGDIITKSRGGKYTRPLTHVRVQYVRIGWEEGAKEILMCIEWFGERVIVGGFFIWGPLPGNA